jgi:hypothetical protein
LNYRLSENPNTGGRDAVASRPPVFGFSVFG